MNDLQVSFQAALADKRFVGQWNAARYFKTLKFSVERRYVEQLLAKKDSKGNPSRLLSCTPESLQVAMLDAAAAGLSLSPSLGHAYLVPYAATATFRVGYRGMVFAALKCGTVKDVQTVLVHAQDPEFKVWTDEAGRHIKHVESRSVERGAVSHAYCIAHFVNGGQHLEVMDSRELAQVEETAKKMGGQVWGTVWKPEMQKKAVTRRAWKFWPIDPDAHMAHLIAEMDRHESLDFERAQTQAGGDLLISEEQALALHAAITDFGLDAELANQWLLKTAQARGYAAIEQLPVSLFEPALTSIKERAKVYAERQREQS